MTVALTSTIIMLGPRAADSNACTGTALPIDLSHRQCHPFQLWRLTQSCRTALEHRQCAPTNRLPLAAIKPPPTSTISEPLPLSHRANLRASFNPASIGPLPARPPGTFSHATHRNPPIPQVRSDDSTIRDKVMAKLDNARWTRPALLSVTVQDGTVDLWGYCPFGRQRRRRSTFLPRSRLASARCTII
jgi:hypothetical protein